MAGADACDVAVVGGGAVALAAALAAARYADVLRIAPEENAAGNTGRGRHYALSRRSRRFLQTLGVAVDDALPVARFLLYAGNTGNSGKNMSIRSPTLTLEESQPLCYMMREEALLQALTARVAAQTAMRHIAAGADDIICDGVNDDDSAITLRLKNKTQEKTVHARLLAAADGARSPLAQQLGIYGNRNDFGQQALVAEITTDALPPASAAQWFDDNDIVALLPLGNRRYSVVWSTAAPPADTSVAGFISALSQRIGISDIQPANNTDDTNTDTVKSFALAAITRPTRVTRRAALLGDAAGTIHPLAGQGLNLGLGDAETFSRTVARRAGKNSADSDTIAAGLAAYNWARARRAQQLQGITQALIPNGRATALLLSAARLPLLRRLAVRYANA